jgi:hypothetical protein
MTGKLLLTSLLLVAVWLLSAIMQFGPTDPMALVVGVVAIWFVWQETRRNNTPIIKVKECEGTGQESLYENDRKLFHLLRILVQNRGVSLWNMGIAIRFRLHESGTMTFHLSPHVDHNSPPSADCPPNGPVEFARGMIAEYSIKSYKLVLPGAVESLLRLKDARLQAAEICVFSQGNLACAIRVGGPWDRLKARWNRFADNVNRRFEKTIERPQGPCPLLIQPKILPTLFVLEHNLMNFVHGLENEREYNRQC